MILERRCVRIGGAATPRPPVRCAHWCRQTSEFCVCRRVESSGQLGCCFFGVLCLATTINPTYSFLVWKFLSGPILGCLLASLLTCRTSDCLVTLARSSSYSCRRSAAVPCASPPFADNAVHWGLRLIGSGRFPSNHNANGFSSPRPATFSGDWRIRV